MSAYSIERRKVKAYGSGYRFNPRRSTLIAAPLPDVPLTALPGRSPCLSNAKPGPYAFSFASRRIFVPSSL